LPGNTVGKLKRLRAAQRLGFVGLNPDKCVAWLRPFIELARTDASRLIEESHAADSPSLMALAEDLANARAFLRGLQSLAAQGDEGARKEVLQWTNACRQGVIALRAEAREHAKLREHAPLIDLTAARRRLLDAPQVDDEPAPVEPTELSREDGSPPADVAPGEGDDSWIDAPAVEPSEPVHEAPEAAPMVREPMTREQVDAGLMARVLTPAKTGGHLCVHKLNPSTCLDCFRSVQAQAPHCRPWRELLPPGHPQRRPPR
jgi:hypothetical protein